MGKFATKSMLTKSMLRELRHDSITVCEVFAINFALLEARRVYELVCNDTSEMVAWSRYGQGKDLIVQAVRVGTNYVTSPVICPTTPRLLGG